MHFMLEEQLKLKIEQKDFESKINGTIKFIKYLDKNGIRSL